MKPIYLGFFCLLLIVASPANAQNLTIGDQSGADFIYNADSDYVTVNLRDLRLPDISDHSSPIAIFFKKLFLNRKKFGLAYVEVTSPFRDPEKTILFTFEKEEADRYRYNYIGASGSVVFPLSKPFVYSQPIILKIVLKQWEDENSGAAVKKIIGAIDQTAVAGNAAAILANATLILDLVEQIFKPDAIEEALTLNLRLSDIKKSDLQITGENSNFFRLSFSTQSGFFSSGDLAAGIRIAGIQDLDSWKKVIHNADLNLKTDGLGPLVSAVFSFSDFISELPLNRSDRAMLTACAIRNWAPNASSGILDEKGEQIQFTAHHYSRLPTGNLEIIRGSDCDFSGVDCQTPQCHAMSDFINKSAMTSGRRQAADLYLRGELTIIIDGVEKVLTVEEFVSKFRISRPAFFRTEVTGPMSWSYHFEPDTLDLSIDGTHYKSKKIRIDIIREKLNNMFNYIVSGIEIVS